MNILLVGVGMQGKAALHDLWQNPAVTSIVAADKELDQLQQYVQRQNYGAKVQVAFADAEAPPTLQKLLAAKRQKLRRIILPAANRRDYSEVPEIIRAGLDVSFVEHFDEVVRLLF